jgi:hypothetical protein
MDFTRKARFVAGGHTTDTPGSITYSSVVSRDSVRLAFLVAGLNDLDVLAGDVTNAYLNAKCREKIWFEGGIETGEDKGKVLIVTRALYGLKSSGAAWRADLAATLRDLKFTSTQADPELNEELGSRFLQLVGILRWAIELGRLDIYVELSQLSQHQALPRRGHLEAIYHIFAYLKKYENGARIVFDPKTPQINECVFKSNADWQNFYGDVTEELPRTMPKLTGQPVVVSCFMDTNHAGNVITRRSHTGILIYVQNAPIIWFSKRQNTVWPSSFGSEFVALQAVKGMVVALRY